MNATHGIETFILSNLRAPLVIQRRPFRASFYSLTGSHCLVPLFILPILSLAVLHLVVCYQRALCNLSLFELTVHLATFSHGTKSSFMPRPYFGGIPIVVPDNDAKGVHCAWVHCSSPFIPAIRSRCRCTDTSLSRGRSPKKKDTLSLFLGTLLATRIRESICRPRVACALHR